VEVTSYRFDARMTHAPVMRLFAHRDRQTVAAMYRLPLRWTWWGLLGRLFGGGGDMIDVVTHFTNGDNVQTSTAKPASVWSAPPFLFSEYVDRSTPLPEMLARHAERVRAYLDKRPASRPTHVRSLEEVCATAAETERRKREYRIAIGWATREELAALSKADGPVLDQLVEAFRRAAA
jgi:hypothetical protein